MSQPRRVWIPGGAGASEKLLGTGRGLGLTSKTADTQTAASGMSSTTHFTSICLSSSPFPLTVTMRILKSISSLCLLQILKCFEMKNGPGERSQDRGRAGRGGPENGQRLQSGREGREDSGPAMRMLGPTQQWQQVILVQ